MKKLFALLLCLALLLAAVSLASAEDTQKVYRTYMGSDCPILNAQNSVETVLDTPTSYCGAYLYRTVPDEDGMGFHYIGDIASELPVQIDEVTWQIPIRPEACWANGDPINADTMIYSYKMLLDPLLVNRMADFLADYNITIVNDNTLDTMPSDCVTTFHTLGTACLMLSRKPSCVTIALTSSVVKWRWMKSSTRLGMLLIISSWLT